MNRTVKGVTVCTSSVSCGFTTQRVKLSLNPEKKSTRFPAQIFMKLANVQIPYGEFHPNRYVGSAERNSVTPLNSWSLLLR
jgi:hypothetical protein